MSKFVVLNDGKIAIEDAKIIFKNFRGESSQYNRNGDKNFCIVIDDDDFARELESANWNVKRKLRDDGTESVYLPVSVSYRIMALAPRVAMYTRKSSMSLTEETIGDLDFSDIETYDIVLRPRHWTDDDGVTHIKAYLSELRAVMNESYFDDKYAAYEQPSDEVSEEMPF